MLQQAVAHGQQWMSTLDIHGYGTPDARQTLARAIAEDNLRRFVALGGTVLYGTDLGNGTLPIGVNAREIRGLLSVGLTDDDIIDAMTRWWGAPCPQAQRVTFVPGAGAADNFAGAGDFAGWLAHARVMNADELENL